MKTDQKMTLRRDNFLVRDKINHEKQFELFVPTQEALQKMIMLMKNQTGLVIMGNLWKSASFYLEVESTHPVFKGTILTEKENQLDIARMLLEKLLLTVR